MLAVGAGGAGSQWYSRTHLLHHEMGSPESEPRVGGPSDKVSDEFSSGIGTYCTSMILCVCGCQWVGKRLLLGYAFGNGGGGDYVAGVLARRRGQGVTTRLGNHFVNHL